jgi:hypothetical protein
MSKERYNKIIDEVYSRYEKNFLGHEDIPNKQLFLLQCEVDKKFSDRWGLRIEERELSIVERLDIVTKTYGSVFDPFDFIEVSHKEIDELYPVPFKEIVLFYKGEEIKVYE